MSGYGFFHPEDVKETKKPAKRGTTLSCFSCGLYKDVRTARMPPWGQNRKQIFCIGEAPGETDDKRGKPWQGKAGQRLQSELRKLGIDLERDCLSFHSANCRPPNNRTPSDHEIACCSAKIVQPILNREKAHTMMLFGGPAVQSIIGDRTNSGGAISLWRGWAIPDQQLKAWICPTFHPSYVERMPDRQEVTTIWRQDMQRALDTLDKPVPDYSNYKKHLALLHNEDEIISVLQRIVSREEGDLCAFDYETTGLKPQAPGHRVATTSVCTERMSYAFVGPQTDKVTALWKRFLRSPNIKKVAQNLKFEDTWSYEMFGVEVRGWEWDPMLASHVLDNRKGVTGLKLQTYLQFGIPDYSKAIDPYLKGIEPRNANSLNRIDEALKKLGEDVVLTYNACDSLFTRWIATRQMTELGHVWS